MPPREHSALEAPIEGCQQQPFGTNFLVVPWLLLDIQFNEQASSDFHGTRVLSTPQPNDPHATDFPF